jgi:hypothetical protein
LESAPAAASEPAGPPVTQDPPHQISALVPLMFMGAFLLVVILYGALSH